MRVYILSNVEDGSERFSNAAEKLGANITSKEINADEKKLADDASIALNNSKPDFVLVVANDPVAANVSLNKQKNVTAAICNTQRDIDLAFKNSVNVIIIGEDVNDPEKFARMLFNKSAQIPQHERPRPARAPPEPRQQQQHHEEKREEEKRKEEPEDTNLPKRPGLLGKLKDSLGIIDEEQGKK